MKAIRKNTWCVIFIFVYIYTILKISTPRWQLLVYDLYLDKVDFSLNSSNFSMNIMDFIQNTSIFCIRLLIDWIGWPFVLPSFIGWFNIKDIDNKCMERCTYLNEYDLNTNLTRTLNSTVLDIIRSYSRRAYSNCRQKVERSIVHNDHLGHIYSYILY